MVSLILVYFSGFEVESRILLCSCDITRRAFPLYSNRVLNLSNIKVLYHHINCHEY